MSETTELPTVNVPDEVNKMVAFATGFTGDAIERAHPGVANFATLPSWRLYFGVGLAVSMLGLYNEIKKPEPDPAVVEKELVKVFGGLFGGAAGTVVGGPVGAGLGAVWGEQLAGYLVDKMRSEWSLQGKESLLERASFLGHEAWQSVLNLPNQVPAGLASSLAAEYEGARSASFGFGSRLLYGTAASDTNLSGGFRSDVIYGLAGNDTLTGNGDVDILVGGDGDDTYILDEAADVVVEEAGRGVDRVIANSAYTLASNVENGEISSSVTQAATMTGNSLDNILANSSARGQTLYGGSGADKLYGGLFNDVLYGGSDNDVDYLVGGRGTDTYYASNGDVIIDGDSQGWVHVAGRPIYGGVYTGSEGGIEHYRNERDNVDLAFNPSTKTLVITHAGQTVTVLNFQNVKFDFEHSAYGLGITLEKSPSQKAAEPLKEDLADASYLGSLISPLVLDLDGDGQVETTAEGTGTRFDLDGNGFAESTGWVKSDDGLLVRDVNGNGSIDSGRELFGDATLLPNGSNASHGFTALASLDSNADGKIDATDAAWSELKVWRDLNQDGKSSSNELISLEDAGVARLNLAATQSTQTDANGNRIGWMGNFVRADGSSGKVYDMYFKRDTMNSVPTDYVQESEAAATLPDLQGFGNVRDLRQAMSTNPELLAAVQALVAQTDVSTLKAGFEQVLLKWTGAAGAVTPQGANWNEEHLRVLDAFNGQSIGLRGYVGQVASKVEAAYQDLLTQLYFDFVSTSKFGDVWALADISRDEATGSTSVDMTAALAKLDELCAAQPDQAASLRSLFAQTADYYNVQRISQSADVINMTKHLGTVVDALAGDDVVNGSAESDTVRGGQGNDTLNGAAGNDVLEGGDGNDVLDGGVGADILRGGSGDDVLGGGAGSADAGFQGQSMYGTAYYGDPLAGNVYEGGTGDDTLRGTSRADTYIYNLGDGLDLIQEVEVALAPTGQVDRLQFGAGIQAADVVVTRSGKNLVLKVSETDQVTVQGWYDSGPSTPRNQVERVEFNDGTVWLAPELTQKGLEMVAGTDGADNLTGVENYVNTIDGGAGNDTITGANLGDTLYGGAGNDTLTGLASDDSLFGGDGDDRIFGGYGNDFLDGSAGDDQLVGDNGNDILDGGAGNDTLDGGAGADVLRGGAGNDILGGATGTADQGYSSNGSFISPGAGNTYEGGTGKDTLNGTSLADVYLFSVGDGADTIIEPSVGTSAPSGQVDVLRFAAGILPSDVSVTHGTGANINDLVIKVGTAGDQVTVKNWYAGTAYRLERLEFEDGTVWTETDLTTKGLVVSGTAGNDSLAGLTSYSNAIHGGDGNDVINGGSLGDALSGGAGNDQLYGSHGNDSLDGGEGDDFLDGGAGADVLQGGAGNDVLGGATGTLDQGYVYNGSYTSPGAGNAYEGGAGNDTLNGTSLADVFLFNVGDGADTILEPNLGSYAPAGQIDVLLFGPGINPQSVLVQRGTGSAANDLVIKTATGNGDQVTVKNWYSTAAYRIEELQFADGTVWTEADLTSRGLTMAGTAGADNLTGLSAYANTIDGGAGNDVITGGNLGDTLLGGLGNDQLYGSHGNDSLDGGEGDDFLDGGAGADVLRGGAGNDILGGAAGTADPGYSYNGSYNSPGAGNTYEGGTGNDTLNGTSLADVYLFNVGDGADTVLEPVVSGSSAGQVDVLRFGADITSSDVSVVRGTGSAANDLIVKVGVNGSDQVTVKNWYSGAGYRVERLEFADGTVWTDADLTSKGLAMTGTSGADTLTGLSNYANDLRGVAGNDTLNGGSLADQLWGGTGNDLLQGAGGDDIYRYLAGDGYDTIADASGASDVLQFDDVDMSAIHYWRQGNDLLVEFGDGSQGVKVTNHFLSGNANRVESFVFNGVVMSSNDMALMVQPKV